MYPVAFEVSGPMALFSDPATANVPTSTHLPPPTACEGMIRNIAWKQGAGIEIIAIGTGQFPRFVGYTCNSHTSPYRKSDQVKGKSGTGRDSDCEQMRATALLNPIYSILAILKPHQTIPIPNAEDGPWSTPGVNVAHGLQEMLLRRIAKGQSWRSVCLGLKEMMATYVGPIRTPIEQRLNMPVPTVLVQVTDDEQYDHETKKSLQVAKYRNGLEIQNGVMHFSEGIKSVIGEDGLLRFADSYLHTDSQPRT